MILAGKILIPIAIVLFIATSTGISFYVFSIKHSLILYLSSIGTGILGLLLIFIGVIRDRIKQIKEEDKDDLSQY